MSIQLVVGEQGDAARWVLEAIPDYQQLLQDFSDALTAESGFRGMASAAFGEGLSAWADQAAGLIPLMEQYATALAGIDSEHGTNDVIQAAAHALLAARLG